jgi:metal-sulfur cluster biosynthetic enzyme
MGDPAADDRIDYTGDPAQRAPLVAALRRVVDPEMAMNIVDLGLVYTLAQSPQQVRVGLTMTSAACPVAEMIMAEVEDELAKILPAAVDIEIDLVWEPSWTPERMTERARRAFG